MQRTCHLKHVSILILNGICRSPSHILSISLRLIVKVDLRSQQVHAHLGTTLARQLQAASVMSGLFSVLFHFRATYWASDYMYTIINSISYFVTGAVAQVLENRIPVAQVLLTAPRLRTGSEQQLHEPSNATAIKMAQFQFFGRSHESEGWVSSY